MKLRRFLKLLNINIVTTSINDRLIMAINFTFWVNFLVNLFFIIFGLFNKSGQLLLNSIYIVISCISIYLLLRKRQFKFALYFIYFQSIFVLSIIALNDLAMKHSYGYLENAIIVYILLPVIFFDNMARNIGLFTNFLLFITLKFYRYYGSSIRLAEILEDLTVALVTYFVIIILGYFYKNDFVILKENNTKLNAQKEIIEEQSKFLQAANATKDRLFNIISHDLRSPITSLHGILQMSKNKKNSHENLEILLKRVSENVDSIQLLLDNLLLWSSFQIKGINAKPTNFLINPFLTETIDLYKEALSQKKIEIISNISSNLAVFGDQQQVRIILRNILNNAIKFTPVNGWIKINGNQNAARVVLTFIDNGFGIKEDELEEIFSAPKINMGTNGETGSGLGLILCKEMATNNGGTIDIKSQVGTGTTVEISFPIEKSFE